MRKKDKAKAPSPPLQAFLPGSTSILFSKIFLLFYFLLPQVGQVDGEWGGALCAQLLLSAASSSSSHFPVAPARVLPIGYSPSKTD